MGWQLDTDCSVAELLDRFDQTDHLIQLLWRPLCIAALNTPMERASAQVFLNVLKDSLGARRSASDMLITRTDLSSLLPQPAADFIQTHGGQVHLGCAVKALQSIQGQEQQQWQLTLKNHVQPEACKFDGIIIATPSESVIELLTPLDLAHHIPAFDYEAITTCYLKYPPGTQLTRPFLALIDQPEMSAWGQFVFDRGQLVAGSNPAHDGLFAVVISASNAAIANGHAELADQCARQLARDLNRPELALPEWSQVISEKRATFACTPGLLRPSNQLPITGLALAGDYTECRYPATLESAVQSGVIAAKLLSPSAR